MGLRSYGEGKMEQWVKLDLPLKGMPWEMAALPELTLLDQSQAD